MFRTLNVCSHSNIESDFKKCPIVFCFPKLFVIFQKMNFKNVPNKKNIVVLVKYLQICNNVRV